MENIIDELYQTYMNESVFDACMIFHQKYINMNAKGINLVDILNDYVTSQSQAWKNYFVSDKTEREFITTSRRIVAAFENMTKPITFQIQDYYPEIEENDEYLYGDIISDLSIAKPHIAFNVDLKTLKEANENYGSMSQDEFNNLVEFINYVKSHNLLNEMTESGSWQMMDFEELIYKLCDKIQDKSIVDKFRNDCFTVHEEGLFDKIKNNCLKISSIDFDSYRPKFNSSKRMRVDFGKYIFALNLKNFFNTGIMPESDGHLYSQIYDSDLPEVVAEFKKLYSNGFDKEDFKNKQSNIIYNPKNYMFDYELTSGKKVEKGNELICGFLITAFNVNSDFSFKDCYLLHIDIEDVTNSCSNYEIQLNIIPDGNFESRIQLIRLDNWENEQVHRNVAKKLSTTTHIHLYNELDILRGKTNGAYDIAFNLEGESTEFNTSLKTFLDILGLDNSIRNEISEKVNQIIIAMNERSNKKKGLIDD